MIGNLREGSFAALVLSVECPQGGKNTAELCKHFLLGVGQRSSPLHHEAAEVRPHSGWRLFAMDNQLGHTLI